MSDIDLDLPEWMKDEWEDASEPDEAEGKTKGYPYRVLPKPYPALPHFGILYLSVERATSLIVRDLYRCNNYPFSTLHEKKLAASKIEKQTAKLETELTTRIQKHILQAISKGRLPAIIRRGNHEDFIEYGDEPPLAGRNFIFYGDILKWLTTNAYVGLPFESYEESELALAKEVEQFIWRRRELQGDDADDSKPTAWIMDKNGPDLEDVMSRALDQIQALKRQLEQASTLPQQEELHQKEKNSVSIILAALLKLRGLDSKQDEDLISNIRRAAERMGHRISDNTIRPWLKEAKRFIPPPKAVQT